jgi:hypothetical protein
LKQNKPTEKEFLQFINLVAKLDHIEFFGIAQILTVPLVVKEEGNDKPKERDFEEIFSDILDKFIELPKKKRKDIVKLLTGDLKVGVKKNGDNTENKSK